MSSNKLKAVVGGFGLVLLFAYQNCAKGVHSTSGSSDKISDAADSSTVTTMSTATDNNLDALVSKLGAEASQHAAALKLCSDGVFQVSSELESNNFNGALSVQSDHVKEVRGLSGSLVLRANSANSKIDLLSNITATAPFENRAIVLCDFNEVSNINNIIGQIILVNSHVASIDGHSGQILLVNSRIDKISNNDGEVLNLVSME